MDTVGNKYAQLLVSLNEKEYQQVLMKQEKIQRIFNVTLTFDVCHSPRWMAIKGGYRDCSNAKSYIRSSLESPENGNSIIYLPPSITDEFIESIEGKSLAAITKNASDGSYNVSGAKITVSMAMTLLEEYAQAEKCMTEMQTPLTKTKSNKASRRLSCALQETLTKSKRKGNYLHASDAVKRAIVGCILDENENTDQVDSKAENNDKATGRTPNKTEDPPEVILIEDDSDDELMTIAEIVEEEDDDIMIIETPRKPPNADGNNHFFGMNFDSKRAVSPHIDDSVIIIGTPTVVDIKQGKKEDALATVTKAFSELQTPSKLKPNSPKKKDTKSVQQPIGSSKQHDTKPTEETKHSNEDSTVLETKSSSKKKKKRKKMKRKLSLSDDDMNGDNVSQEYGKIRKKEKSYDSEEKIRKRRILKSGKKAHKEDRVKDVNYKINLVPSKPNDKNTDKGKENSEKAKAQYQTSERDRKVSRFSDKTSKMDDDMVSTTRRAVTLPTKVTAKDKTAFTEKRSLKITSKVTSKDENVTTGSRTVTLPTKDETASTERRTIKIAPRTTSTNVCVKDTSDEKQSNDQSSKSTGIGGNGGIDEPDGRRPSKTEPILRPIEDYRTPRRNDLRYIVIDGSNVAMAHGKNVVFSCIGLRICVEFFLRRGHRLITVFLPHWRKCRPQFQSSMTHRGELDALEKEGYLVYTPSRKIGNKLVAAYDDRFIIELADREDGIVVSNDQYRDLHDEKYSWRNIIQNRLLMYTFVHDHFMVPNDPLGRYGPHLDQFLRHKDLRQTLKTIQTQHMAPVVEDGHNDFLLCSR